MAEICGREVKTDSSSVELIPAILIMRLIFLMAIAKVIKI